MTDAGKRLVEILNRKRTEDTCSCSHCEEAIAAWDGQPCKTCGFAGKPVAIACQCYDHHCSGGTSAGAGCPHGALTCPVCDDGNLDAFAVIRELRSALAAFEVEQDEREARKTGRHPNQPVITNSSQASNPLVIQPATVEEVARAITHIKERMAWRTGHRRSEVADIRVEHLQTALRALESIANLRAHWSGDSGSKRGHPRFNARTTVPNMSALEIQLVGETIDEQWSGLLGLITYACECKQAQSGHWPAMVSTDDGKISTMTPPNQPATELTCPFCGESGFDLIGLKSHLLNHCQVFEDTQRIPSFRTVNPKI